MCRTTFGRCRGRLQPFEASLASSRCGACRLAYCSAQVRELRRTLRQRGLPDDKRDLRRALRLLRICKEKAAEAREDAERRRDRREYTRDPAGFVARLFDKPQVEPEFSQAECEAYFTETMSDPLYDQPFVAEPWLPPQPEPSVPFRWPSIAVGAVKKVLAPKANKSSPGPDGIRYLVFKRCQSLLPYLSHFYARFIVLRVFPDSCRYGLVKLLFKAAPASAVKNFRPITLANTIGKLFMSMLTRTLTAWSRAAGIIDTSWQKGFMPGLPGCIEHAMRAVGAIRDAKAHGRSLVCVFIDLANAFGSVPHAGVLFVLHWSGLPLDVQQLIQNYYASLRVIVQTRAFRTRAIQQKSGTFQGDPLSVIIFNLFINPLYRWYAMEAHKQLAYTYFKASLRILGTGFADDVSLFCCRVAHAQYLLNGTDRFLAWARMRANANKCKALAVRKGQTRVEVYDPVVTISGSAIPMITENDGFKLLGRYFYPSMSLERQEARIVETLASKIRRLDETQLAGTQKVHALRLNLVGWLGWDLSMYPFSVTFVEQKLEQPVRNAVARWLGLPDSASKEVFFLPRHFHGLSIPSPLTMFKQRQAGTAHMLKYSEDPQVSDFYELERRRVAEHTRWSGIQAVELFDQQLDPGEVSKRRALLTHIKQLDDEARWAHIQSLSVQGKALSTLQCASHDPDWMDQVLQVPSSLFKFGMCSLLDVLPTNCNAYRWNKRADRSCPHCGRPQTTLHVLNNCPLTLDKYTWRHDSVLRTIVNFVSEHLVDSAQLHVDLEGHPRHYALLPPLLCQTLQRPDIVLFDEGSRRVALVELTVPAEENIDSAARRKKCKYKELVKSIEESWDVEFVSIEIGSRGNMLDSLSCACSTLVRRGLLRRYTFDRFKSLSILCSIVALRASFMIWLTRLTPAMPKQQLLLS